MKFVLNQPIETAEATVEVDAGLAPGAYRFRLVVVNRRGQASTPAEATVTILDGRDPTRPVVRDPSVVTPVTPVSPLPRDPSRPQPPSL